MSTGPTNGASESANEWLASPSVAFTIRFLAYAVPFAAAYLGVRLMSSMLYRPVGWLGLLVWITQACVVAGVISRGVGRITRRLLPLATLFKTTLVFPDRAPSRFAVALRAGTVKQMRKRAAEFGRDGLGATEAEAAENAIVLVTGLGRHDRLTRGHTERVRAYADVIADELHLSVTDRHRLAWGVLLHDVGKMTVPPEILNKVETLTASEWEILKNHPTAGEQMLSPLAGWLGEWGRAAGEHHERWDGRGYPRGLAGHEISLAGRITAVADAYDVITSKRSYKDPMSAEAARRELVDCAGSQFDPAVVRAFMDVSLGHRPDVGSLAWLTDLPGVRATASIAATPVAASVGAAALVTSLLLGLGDDSAARRDAFAAELSSKISISSEATQNREPEIPGRPTGGDDGLRVSDVDPTQTMTVADVDPAALLASNSPLDAGVTHSTAPLLEGDGAVVATTAPTEVVPSLLGAAEPAIATVTTVPLLDVSPEIVLGSVSLLPSVTVLPSASVPLDPVTTPSITVPEVTVPPVTVPETTVPEVTVPELPVFGGR